MSRVIWKYALEELTDEGNILANIINVRKTIHIPTPRHNKTKVVMFGRDSYHREELAQPLSIWVEADDASNLTQARTFVVRFTGTPIPGNEDHLFSWRDPKNNLVYHLFEVG